MKMGEVKRWSVTYTKHIKQKRKLYQDGFLELHSSIHKVMLYDDCEKHLDSRFVKKDEVISSGETIALGSYLVDIGDSNGDRKPTSNLDFQGTDKKINGESRSLHGRSFRSSFVSSANIREKKNPSSSLSPSQRIIREFKKSEMIKYSTSPSGPDTANSKTTEWQVLYTKHLTQKAKKYHDGFLQLALCGSQGRQIMLYDASRQLLDSRFLKRNEVIKSGESLAFDGHLVDIGECEGDNKPLNVSNVQGKTCKIFGKTDTRPNIDHIHTKSSGEWDMVYTTQLTQKTKKYNCGILRVAPCGSYRMQATLVSEDGNILGHKFLGLSEDVRTGNTLPFPNYLVEVGEQRQSLIGDQQNNASSYKNVDLESKSTVVNVKFGRMIQVDKPALNEKDQDNAAPTKNVSETRSSTVDCSIQSSRPTSTLIRPACEILSFIKKPVAQEEIITMGRPTVKQYHSAVPPDSINSDLKNLGREPVQNFNHKRVAVVHLDEETMAEVDYKDDVLQPKADKEVHRSAILNLVDSQNRAECQATKSNFSRRSEAADMLHLKPSTESLDSNETRPTSPVLKPEDIVCCNSDSIGQPQIASLLFNSSETQRKEGISTDQKHLVADLTCPSFDCNNGEKLTGPGTAAVYCSGSTGSSKEHHADSGGIDERCNEVSGAGRIVPNCYSACEPSTIEEKNMQQDTTTRQMDEFPSFDLGF